MPSADELNALWNAIRDNYVSLWGGILGIIFSGISVWLKDAQLKRVFLIFSVVIFFISFAAAWIDEHRARIADKASRDKETQGQIADLRKELKNRDDRIAELKKTDQYQRLTLEPKLFITYTYNKQGSYSHFKQWARLG